jgi:arginase
MTFVDLIACPFDSSGSTDGVARMPAALLDAGLAAMIPGSRVAWVDVPQAQPGRGRSGLLGEDALAATVTTLATQITRAWTGDGPPIVLGGDCPVLLGPLVAARGQGTPVGLVFVDGHEDAWDPRRSPTGEAADSEIALALGWAAPPPALAQVLPCLDADALVQLGPRDASELAHAGQPSIGDRVPVLAGHRLAADNGLRTAHDLAADLVARHPAWWLHVDLDVLSTIALPAVDYPQPGGLTWAQLDELTRTLLGLGGCQGISVCIYNPDLDAGTAATVIATYIADAARTLAGNPGPTGPRPWR